MLYNQQNQTNKVRLKLDKQCFYILKKGPQPRPAMCGVFRGTVNKEIIIHLKFVITATYF